MKKVEKILAAAMAVCICTSLAACGDSDNSEESTEKSSSSVSESSESSETEGADEVSDEDSESEDEPEGLIDELDDVENDEELDENYLYYNILAAAYKNGYQRQSLKNFAFKDKDGIIYAANYERYVFGSNSMKGVLKYDPDTKEAKVLAPYSEDIDDYRDNSDFHIRYYFSNGYIYKFVRNSRKDSYYQVKYDMDGNELGRADVYSPSAVTDSGKIVSYEFDRNSNKLFVYPTDWSEGWTAEGAEYTDAIELLPDSELNMTFCAVYENKIICKSDYSLWTFDTDTLEWSKLSDLDFELNGSNSVCITGKFLLYANAVINLENGEVLAHNDSGYYGSSYFGGLYSICPDGNEVEYNGFYKTRLSSDNTPPDFSELEKLELTGSMMPIDLNTYVYAADHDVYLCTFDGDEEIIMTFKNDNAYRGEASAQGEVAEAAAE